MDSKKLKLALAGIALVGLAVITVILLRMRDIAVPIEKQSNTTETSASVAEELDAKIYNIGDELAFATMKLKVNSARVSNSISSQYSQVKTADPGTKFLLVNMTVTNTTQLPFIYSPFIVLDDKDRLYQSSTDAIVYLENYLEGKQLAPGVPVTGVSLYQVPLDSTEFRIGSSHSTTQELMFVKFKPTE